MTALLRDQAPVQTLAELVSALPGSTILQLDRREVVYHFVDREPAIYVVLSGQVKVLTTSRDGKECLLGIYGRGDVVGEVCLDSPDRAETVVTMTPTVLRRFSRARFLLALSDGGVREEFVRLLARRLAEQQRLITDFVTTDSEHRLAAILLHLARKAGRRTGPVLVLDARITQEELARMVGTTRSRVGLFLKRFILRGLVLRRRNGGLAIHEERLEAFMSDC